ncbi:MAG: redoxin domain-containing protein [Candidatus Dormibacteraeota bacterium]|nr:redoxin domain-containing protein [Candidatus Dormibacteraeota bacterium]
MTIPHSRTFAWRSALVLVVVLTAMVFAVRGTSSSPQPAATSTSATNWELPRLIGIGSVKLADLRGHPVVLNFFASWCTACRGELPGMATLSHQLSGRVTFAGIDSQETGDGLAMARQYGIDGWPLARDVGGTQASGLHDSLGARGMPVTAFYDSSGRLLSVVPGAIGEDDLRARIRALFGISD